jgi:pilus assembly protein CpaC
VVLSGTVTDLAAAEAALNLTQAFARQLVHYLGAAPAPVPVSAAGADKVAPAASAPAGGGGELGTQVINLLRVRDDQRLTPLSAALRQALPQEQDIRLGLALGTVVLSGTVSNTLAADTALRLAEAFGRKTRTAVNADGSTALSLLAVRDAQQVMLDVRIAEVSKSLLDKLGVGVQAGGGGGTRWNILSSFLGGGGAAAGLLFRNGNAINLDAEKNDGLVRILAEPTIVAMSGQEGSFLVGGTVFIPVAQSGTSVTLQEREFGVGLKFVPTVLDGGRISLKVATEVSEISKESLRNPGSAALLPAFTTRKVATSVQLQDGQSLVIGGLIRNNSSANTSAFPLLGELPIIGALFRSSQFVSDLTELVVVVRTSLVKATGAAPALPTDAVTQPSRRELFLDGRLQGRPPEPEPKDASESP